MYEYIYEEMIDAHITSPHENPVYTDHEGNEVEEHKRFGLDPSPRLHTFCRQKRVSNKPEAEQKCWQ